MNNVITDTEPLTMVEAHYDDARFYLKEASIKDTLSIYGNQDDEQ